MSPNGPLQHLPIETADKGFYNGFSMGVTLPSKIIVASLIVWAIAFPDQANGVLNSLNAFILDKFGAWYIWVVTFFVAVCFLLALWPSAGKLKLAKEGEEPEFSNFSWFSMMFGAGIGVGMLTWAVAEPVYHFSNNPEVITGLTHAASADNVRMAYKWSFLHWGLGAWACYAVVGLSLAYFSYRRDLPLTPRSSLTPLFGKTLSGPLGHLVDIVAVVATILGIAQALGFGVEQFVAGMYRIGFGEWLLNQAGTATPLGILFAISVIMVASTLSALSGVGRGIKWLSNINMGLSLFLLSFFLLFGATWFGVSALFVGMYDYLLALPQMLFEVWPKDGSDVGDKLAKWQGDWSIFYWAWWVAFAPFVGVFLARISKGRSVREFVLGAMIVPSIMCFIWFSFAGGTAISLELSGVANGAISAAPDGAKIFVMTDFLLSSTLGWLMAIVIVILLLTYLVTSADSAVLVINTINAAGDEGPKAHMHIIFWGTAIGIMVAALLMVGGLDTIRTAMVIGALPFSMVMALMCCSVIKAIYNDGMRERTENQ